ncbi:MAG: hypothetical protein U0T75_07735 [Chitinophagales bacterium]
MKLYKFALLFASVTLLVLPSSKKIREDNFIKGLWRLKSIYVDTITTNQMDVLPYFSNGNNCCEYRLDFQDNDVLFGYYFTYDTFNNSGFAVGTWKLNSYNTVDIELGGYLDGRFDIEKPSPKTFRFTSDANHIKAFDGIYPALDTAKTEVNIEQL